VSNRIIVAALSTNYFFQNSGLPVQTAGWGITDRNINPRSYRIVDLTVLSYSDCVTRLSQAQGQYMEMDISVVCTVAEPYALIGAVSTRFFRTFCFSNPYTPPLAS
jgi:hypothetical protein